MRRPGHGVGVAYAEETSDVTDNAHAHHAGTPLQDVFQPRPHPSAHRTSGPIRTHTHSHTLPGGVCTPWPCWSLLCKASPSSDLFYLLSSGSCISCPLSTCKQRARLIYYCVCVCLNNVLFLLITYLCVCYLQTASCLAMEYLGNIYSLALIFGTQTHALSLSLSLSLC